MPVSFIYYGETDENFPQLNDLRVYFDRLTENEKTFVNQIRELYKIALGSSSRGTTETGSHVFFGGHVVVNDKGNRYQTWKEQLEKGELQGGKRTSSHYGNVGVQQYEIRLPKLGCVLFGTTSDTVGVDEKPDRKTWFQNESWPATEPGIKGKAKFVAHGVLGYGAHKMSGNKQVGALGYSPCSEKNGRQLTVPYQLVPNS
jgi:hypothetical protein